MDSHKESVCKIKASYTLSVPLVLFALSLLWRVIYYVQIKGYPEFSNPILDAQAYHMWAVDIVSGNWLGDRIFYQAPFYPYIVAVIYLLFGVIPTLVIWIQYLLGCVTTVLIYFTAKELSDDSKVGIIASLIFLFYGVILFYEGFVEKTAFTIFFFAVWLFFACRIQKNMPLEDRPRFVAFFVLGFLFAILVLLRGNFLLLLPIVLIWHFFFLCKTASAKVALIFVSLFIAGTTLGILPVTVRNYLVGKDFVLTTSQFGQNFYIGNNPHAEGFFEAPKGIRLIPEHEEKDFKSAAEKQTGRSSMSPSEISAFWLKEGINYVAAHPWRTVRLLWRKFVFFWNNIEIPDNYNFYVFADNAPILKYLCVRWNLIVSLAVVGFIFGVTTRQSSFLVLIILGYMLSILPFHMASRYRIPIVAALVLGAAFGVIAIWDSLKTICVRPFRFMCWRRFMPLLIFFSVFVITTLHVVDKGKLFRSAWMNIGAAYAEAGNYEEAYGAYRRAIELDPKYPYTHYNLGLLYVKQDMLDEAIREFETTLKINPGFGPAWNNLGILYLGNTSPDNLKKAKTCFLQSIEKGKELCPAYNGLGLVYFMQKNYQQAEETFLQGMSYCQKFAPLKYNLACTYSRKGDVINARKFFEEAVALDPSYRVKAETDPDIWGIFSQ